ncbi:MAG: transposase, partial [Gemmatimonadota bacterium]
GHGPTATEPPRVSAAVLRERVARGVQAPTGLRVVLDGARRRSAAERDVFGERVPRPRCQWHKRENVQRYLPQTHQVLWRRKLQPAYGKATYGEAQRALRQLVKALEQQNASAARSLEEGLDETLTLHRLEVFTTLGISFTTTNLIERVMARVEAKTHRISRWRTSDQKQRWCAATLLEIEKQFRKVKGQQHLGLLQAALRGKPSSPLAAA